MLHRWVWGGGGEEYPPGLQPSDITHRQSYLFLGNYAPDYVYQTEKSARVQAYKVVN